MRLTRMERRPKTAHEMILIQGFAKVTNDPILQGARADVVIGVGRHEDRRNGSVANFAADGVPV
jgi:hypothetical protein